MSQTRSGPSLWSDPPLDGMPWTILHLVTWSSGYLEGKGITGARLDVEHLLAHILGMDRLQLYLDFDRPVPPDELARFKPLLRQRARRKPLQYILGRTSFRDLELLTDSRVLIPRPETEELVEAILEQVGGWGRQSLRALDVGTGSGAIALSLAHEGPFGLVVATDSSAGAVEVAQANAGVHGLEGKVEFRIGESLDPLRPGEQFHVLVSNPPYVTEEDFESLEAEVRVWEPRSALVAAEGGLAVLNDLVSRAPTALTKGGLLALEVGAGQAPAVTERIRSTVGFDPPVVLRDFGRVERLVLATWWGEGQSGLDRIVAGEARDDRISLTVRSQ